MYQRQQRLEESIFKRDLSCLGGWKDLASQWHVTEAALKKMRRGCQGKKGKGWQTLRKENSVCKGKGYTRSESLEKWQDTWGGLSTARRSPKYRVRDEAGGDGGGGGVCWNGSVGSPEGQAENNRNLGRLRGME